MRLSSSLVWSSFFFLYFSLFPLSSVIATLFFHPSHFQISYLMYNDNPNFRNVVTQNKKFPYQKIKKTCKIMVRIEVISNSCFETKAICLFFVQQAICLYTIIFSSSLQRNDVSHGYAPVQVIAISIASYLLIT